MSKELVLVTQCDCLDASHQARFTLTVWGTNDSIVDLEIDTQLNATFPQWKRVWYGLLYVLGQTTPYGHWASGGIDLKSAEELKALLNRFIRLTKRAAKPPVDEGLQTFDFVPEAFKEAKSNES